jgi:hypothetical protein
VSLLLQSAQSFQNAHSTFHRRNVSFQSRKLQSLFDSKPIALNSDTVFIHQDKNGKDILVDSLVRVAAANLKAFHVNKSGFGSYNDKKEFVQSTEFSYLLLPKGLCGRVIRVYDENVIGANLPILIKFTPGDNIEEGYDAPAPFTMHFLPDEVECV